MFYTSILLVLQFSFTHYSMHISPIDHPANPPIHSLNLHQPTQIQSSIHSSPLVSHPTIHPYIYHSIRPTAKTQSFILTSAFRSFIHPSSHSTTPDNQSTNQSINHSGVSWGQGVQFPLAQG